MRTGPLPQLCDRSTSGPGKGFPNEVRGQAPGDASGRIPPAK